MWFTEFTGNRIGRITRRGEVTEFGTGINPLAVLIGIAAGPDGNLRFAEFTSNQIGRITPASVITEFSMGTTPGAAPYGITADSRGLWFTEQFGDQIGRVRLTVGDFSDKNYIQWRQYRCSPAGLASSPNGPG